MAKFEAEANIREINRYSFEVEANSKEEAQQQLNDYLAENIPSFNIGSVPIRGVKCTDLEASVKCEDVVSAEIIKEI